jgi:MFS family permease
MLVGGRCLVGVGAACSVATRAYVARVVPPKHRTAWLGMQLGVEVRPGDH